MLIHLDALRLTADSASCQTGDALSVAKSTTARTGISSEATKGNFIPEIRRRRVD